MVQILNKMVHLKYPTLEIWCCQKHITQLPPARLNLIQSWGVCSKTIWHHSSAQVILSGKILHPILSVCSSQSNASMHVKLRFLATLSFGTCYSSQMPSSRLKCGKKPRNTFSSRFVSTALHKSLLQAKYIEYCM